MKTGREEDMMTGSQDDRKLRRRLTVWYISILLFHFRYLFERSKAVHEVSLQSRIQKELSKKMQGEKSRRSVCVHYEGN